MAGRTSWKTTRTFLCAIIILFLTMFNFIPEYHPLEINWYVSSKCHNDGYAYSCNDTCEGSCVPFALGTLTSEDRVRNAVMSAGLDCARYSEFRAWFMFNFDGPWINAIDAGWFWRPNCATRPPCGFAKICPCFKAMPLAILANLEARAERIAESESQNFFELQAFFAESSRDASTWEEELRNRHAPRLQYAQIPKTKITHPVKANVRWIPIRSACFVDLAGSSLSCSQLCGMFGGHCQRDALKAITSGRMLNDIASRSDITCKRFFRAASQNDNITAGAPWIDLAGTCAYALKSSGWKPDCDVGSPPKTNRFCPCDKADLDMTCSSFTKSSEWHQQWYHTCNQSSSDVRPGPINRHLHFVLLQEREWFINHTFPYTVIDKMSYLYPKLNQEEQVLVELMHHAIRIHNASSVHIHTEESCRLALSKLDPSFVKVFEKEPDVRFKSDLCRSAAVYLEGGLYSHDDQVYYRSIFDWLKPGTHFASVQPDHDLLTFQVGLIAATPCHPLLRRQIDLMISDRTPGSIEEKSRTTAGEAFLLGPHTMRMAYSHHYSLSPAQIKRKSLRGDLPPGTQLMREVLMKSKKHSPIPRLKKHFCEFAFYDPLSGQIYACARP